MDLRRISLAMDRRSNLSILPAISIGKRIGNNKIRFMNYADIPNVEKLLEDFGRVQARLVFGNFDMAELWSISYISILLEDSKEVIAAMVLNNYPNIPSIPQSAWESWLKNKYSTNLESPYNTLWVHLYLFKASIKEEVTDAMLKFVFKKFLQIEFVMFVIPPNIYHLDWLIKLGTVISPALFGNARNKQRLILFRRISFVSSYKTRSAVIEDNDDIVALLDKTCPRMKKIYGKHYIAEIINDNRSTRRVIVAEYEGAIVAAMMLNSEINYDMLNNSFHMEITHGLKKPTSKMSISSEAARSSVESTKIEFGQMRQTNLSDFTLHTPSNIFEAEPKQRSKLGSSPITSISEVDFDIDLDLPSLSSSDSEPRSSDEISTDSMFIGHLEVNMSCVVLSYSGLEIQRFMSERKTTALKSADVSRAKLLRFDGDPNAFAIEAIAAAKTHEFAVNLLLFACYECFPYLDYCLLSLPCSEPTPPILKNFVRANTRRDVTVLYELYFCHKLSVLGSFSAREAHKTDFDEITEFIGSQKNTKILNMFTMSVLNSKASLRSYVFLCNGQLIGFAILDEEYDVEYVYSQYYCKEVLTDIPGLSISHGKILYFTILPIFEKQSRYFLQELHRLSEYSRLYYSLPGTTTKNIPSIISDMILAVPIPAGECKPNKNYWNVPRFANENKSIPALFISTPFICARPRIEVNTRIVVVGASDAGLSFVLALLLKSNSDIQNFYNNITIVSAHGINRYDTMDKLIPTTSNINRSMLDMYAFNTNVDVMEGIMTDINRKDRTITVSNQTICYDILILTCGLQYQMPRRSPEMRRKRVENPENVYVVNTEVDASLCLDRLKKLWSVRQNNVIVYGHALNAYCCITALLHIGLPEKFLVFVDFNPQGGKKTRNQIPIFTDSSIEESVLSAMKDRGVRLYKGVLYSWEFDDFERLKSATFQCNTRRITIDCIAMFAYETKYLCQTTLEAIKAAGLIFDSGLLITPDFKTNDPFIFAAGTCTKYRKKYYAGHKNQKYYNQVEIGRVLAQTIIGNMMGSTEDPLLSFRCISRHQLFVPEYNQPLSVNCVLPGGVNYFCVRKPGLLASIGIYTEGEILTTGDANNLAKQGYFRVHINKYGIIDEIACISLSSIDIMNLTNVWGKHEVLFKKMYTRYKVGQIEDFFEFFRGHEFCAIYHHMFPHLLDNIASVLLSRPDRTQNKHEDKGKMVCLFDDIMELFKANNGQQFKRRHYRLLKNLFTGSVYEEKIVQMVMSFLGENRAALPMYAHPMAISIVLNGYKDSNFFKEKNPKG